MFDYEKFKEVGRKKATIAQLNTEVFEIESVLSNTFYNDVSINTPYHFFKSYPTEYDKNSKTQCRNR